MKVDNELIFLCWVINRSKLQLFYMGKLFNKNSSLASIFLNSLANKKKFLVLEFSVLCNVFCNVYIGHQGVANLSSYLSVSLFTFRSSLAFAQEVQDSKEMDELMGKVTNLFSANTTANTRQNGRLILF